jgi:DNA-binding MarR family transcriptional regulator
LTELARKVVLSKSGLTRLVDKLVEAGLLERQSSPEDGRGAYAVLTDSGFEAMRKAWPVYAQGIQDYFAQHLNADEVQMMTQALGRMLAATET